VIQTTPYPPREVGGFWWDVAVPEVSDRAEVREARAAYAQHVKERAPT
jgi:3D-(3,5/4)-trihydroxycyclohexane-1,2-dione acylhydrolase (decyclizing)